MMPNFGETLRLPTRDPEWPVKVLLGGVAVLLSPLVLPMIIYTGYLVAVLRRAVRDPADARLPEWFEGFEKLVLDGLVGYLTQLAVNFALYLLAVPGFALLTIGVLIGLSGAGQPVYASALLTW